MTQAAPALKCSVCGYMGPSVAFQCHVDREDSEFAGEYHLSIRCADPIACEGRAVKRALLAREPKP